MVYSLIEVQGLQGLMIESLNNCPSWYENKSVSLKNLKYLNIIDEFDGKLSKLNKKEFVYRKNEKNAASLHYHKKCFIADWLKSNCVWNTSPHPESEPYLLIYLASYELLSTNVLLLSQQWMDVLQ